jgi:hypothetical protein
MNCFYHPDKPAVAICKSCARGLCMECGADIENGLACKGRCEERGRIINRIVDSNRKVLAAANTQLRGNMIFIVMLGLIVAGLGAGALVFEHAGLPGGILIGVGVIFILRGIFSYTRAARYPAPDKTE